MKRKNCSRTVERCIEDRRVLDDERRGWQRKMCNGGMEWLSSEDANLRTSQANRYAARSRRLGCPIFSCCDSRRGDAVPHTVGQNPAFRCGLPAAVGFLIILEARHDAMRLSLVPTFSIARGAWKMLISRINGQQILRLWMLIMETATVSGHRGAGGTPQGKAGQVCQPLVCPEIS